MTEIDRNKLRALAMAATPGEWSVEPHGKTTALYSGRETSSNWFANSHGLRLLNLDDGDWNFTSNAAYIAAANPKHMIALLDQIEKAELDLAFSEESKSDADAEYQADLTERDTRIAALEARIKRKDEALSWIARRGDKTTPHSMVGLMGKIAREALEGKP